MAIWSPQSLFYLTQSGGMPPTPSPGKSHLVTGSNTQLWSGWIVQPKKKTTSHFIEKKKTKKLELQAIPCLKIYFCFSILFVTQIQEQCSIPHYNSLWPEVCATMAARSLSLSLSPPLTSQQSPNACGPTNFSPCRNTIGYNNNKISSYYPIEDLIGSSSSRY